MPKIPALPPMTSPDGLDELPIEDVSANTTKYITLTALKNWLASVVGWIVTAMYADGSVTGIKLGTPAAFSVYKNAAQSLANGTFVVISWNAEQFDTVNGHDNVTNNSRFTIPAGYSGKWLFSGAVNFAAAGGATRICAFYKNGAMYNGKRETVAGANTYTAEHNKIIDVVAGDYIEVAGYQDSGGAINAQGAAMPGLDIGMFDGVYLGKT